MALLTINGIEVRDPNKLEVGNMDIQNEDAGRTQTGKMEFDVIATKRKLSCSWSGLTWQEVSELIKAVESKKFFNIRYPDPKECDYVIKEFYVGDRTMPAVYMVKGQEVWSGTTMNFIER